MCGPWLTLDPQGTSAFSAAGGLPHVVVSGQPPVAVQRDRK